MRQVSGKARSGSIDTTLALKAIQAVGTGVTIVDALAPDMPIVFINATFEKLTGYTAAEVMGRNCRFLHGDDCRQPELDTVRAALAAQKSVQVVLRNYRKDSSPFWNELTISPIYDEDGTVTHFVGVQEEVTEKVRLQLQIIQAAKLAALADLVTRAAHEINNPLAAISGHAQLLALHPDTQVQEDACAIRRMTDRASKIVNSLGSHAGPGDDSDKSVRLQDLNAVIQNALDTAIGSLQAAEVRISLALSEDLPLVSVNDSEIEQVIISLLSNAELALRDKPPAARLLSLRSALVVDSGRTFCSLTVSDTGTGISSAVLPRIFEPFFTGRDVGQGMGLGLYMSHIIVMAHGGKLTADSREGEGSTFTLLLPAADTI